MSANVLHELKIRSYLLSKRNNIQRFLDSGEGSEWQREQLTLEVENLTSELLRPIPIVPGLGGDGAALLSA